MRPSIAQRLILACLASSSLVASDRSKPKLSQLLGVPDSPVLGSRRPVTRPKADPFKPDTAATRLRAKSNVIAPGPKAHAKVKAKPGAPPALEALDLKAARPDPVRRNLAPLVTEEQRVTLLEASLRRPFDVSQRVENKAKAPVSLDEFREPESSTSAEETLDATSPPVASPAREYLAPEEPAQNASYGADRLPLACCAKPRDPGEIWTFENKSGAELALRVQVDHDEDQTETCVRTQSDPNHVIILWPYKRSTFMVAKDEVIEVWILHRDYSRQSQVVDGAGKVVAEAHLPLPRLQAAQAPAKAPEPEG